MGLKACFADRWRVVGECEDGRQAVELARRQRPDLVTMPVAMPGLGGLEACERIGRLRLPTRVMILTRHDHDEYLWQALHAGAWAYLLKTAAPAELIRAVQCVTGGQVYLNAAQCARRLARRPQSPLEQLTDRQREVLKLIAEGQTTKAIAGILRVSPKTVEYHRAKLMRGVDLFDVPGLVRFAVRCGLTEA